MTDFQSKLKEKLMGEIKAGKVAMTPRMYFTLKLVGLAAVAIGILVVTVFIFNFISFSLRINDHNALLGFGSRGVWEFLRFFPWPLLALDIALIVLLQWLVRHFSFGYKIPVLYVVGALLLGGAAVGFGIDYGTPLNDRLHEGREHLPPPMRGIYEGARREPHEGSGMCRCKILAIEGSVLTVRNESGATLQVTLPANDRHATTSNLKIGDTVFIAGEENNGDIDAFGVRKEDGERHGFR